MLGELNEGCSVMAGIINIDSIPEDTKNLASYNLSRLLILYSNQIEFLEKLDKQQNSAIMQPGIIT